MNGSFPGRTFQAERAAFVKAKERPRSYPMIPGYTL